MEPNRFAIKESTKNTAKRKREEEIEPPVKKRKVLAQNEAEETPPTPTAKQRKKKIELDIGKLQPYVVCPLCKLFFVDCVTLVECMHSFCEGCLRKHFWFYEKPVEDAFPYRCPVCHGAISGGNPVSTKARHDLQKQNITDQVRLLLKKAEEPEKPKERIKATAQVDKVDFAQLIAVVLLHEKTPKDPEGFTQIVKNVHRLEKSTTVKVVKKLVSYGLNDAVGAEDIEMFCDGKPLANLHCVEFIRRTCWMGGAKDMIVKYRFAGGSDDLLHT